MITQIELEHFKCFDRQVLALSPLTLLSGVNASGKSSIMQSLVLLHQTAREHEWAKRLMFNGDALQLGTMEDVLDHESGREKFAISLTSKDTTYRWEFSCAGKNKHDLSAPLSELCIAGKSHGLPESLHHLLPADGSHDAMAQSLRRLTYIMAERIGPRDVYPLTARDAADVVVGARGENAASMLYQGRDNEVMQKLHHKDEGRKNLHHQVNAWMQEFFPGFDCQIERVPNANLVSITMKVAGGDKFVRPANTGFGLTQTLPVIVAALTAKQGDVLLIENPEVHLHPAGQARIGRFLAEIAAAGVQVILESHSDHILNGIRRAVKDGTIPCDDVSLHFLQNRSADPRIFNPSLNSKGSVSEWPSGFFDQLDKDLDYFADWGS